MQSMLWRYWCEIPTICRQLHCGNRGHWTHQPVWLINEAPGVKGLTGVEGSVSAVHASLMWSRAVWQVAAGELPLD